MKTLVELIAKRKTGHVRVAYATNDGVPLDQLLARFGLAGPEGHAVELRETTASEACSIVTGLLRFDMAYNGELMSEHDAETLAAGFFTSFPAASTRFLTNLEALPNSAASWTPLTHSTFDAGVICLQDSVAACIWFEDED